jgi:predicted RNA-binding protein
MCLARVYIGNDDETELLMEEIASLKTEGGKLLMTSLFGEEREIEASIKEIDFMGSRVVLENAKA